MSGSVMSALVRVSSTVAPAASLGLYEDRGTLIDELGEGGVFRELQVRACAGVAAPRRKIALVGQGWLGMVMVGAACQLHGVVQHILLLV